MENRDGRKGMGVGEGARGHEWMYSVCMKCEKINTISHEMCMHGVSLLPLYSLSVNSCLPLEAIGLPLADQLQKLDVVSDVTLPPQRNGLTAEKFVHTR